MTVLTRHTMLSWVMRGPSIGHGHGSGLANTFLHAVVRAFAWFTVRGLFTYIGLPLVLIGAVVIGLVWLRNRKRGEQS